MAAPRVVGTRVDSTPNERKSKKPFRFSAHRDVLLLREVIKHNPFVAPKKWNEIGENLQRINMPVDARRCRERTTLLLTYFSNEDFENLRRSGTEEEHAVKEQLLQEIMDMKNGSKMAKEDKNNQKKQTDADSVAAQEVWREVLESLESRSSSPELISGHKKGKRSLACDVLDYLREKSRREFELRQQEITLQERRLLLEEQRFQADKEERAQLMELLLSKLP